MDYNKHLTAKLRFLRIAPRKVRLVADLVRGKNVQEALTLLQFTLKRASLPVAKLLMSAVANATEGGEVDVDTLYIKHIQVDEGPTMRRFRPRAYGRATRINKRTSHVRVELDEQVDRR